MGNILKSKDNNLLIAEKHLGKYLSDLQAHFNYSEIQIIKILHNQINLINKNIKPKSFFKLLKNHLQELFHK